MSEERKRIKIVIDEFTGGSFRYEGGEIEGIRIFPACKYADCGSRRLSPVELNEAVQMWMNRAPTNGPVNVKGDLVNSLQEEGKSPIQHLQDRVLDLEQHQGRDRADLMEKIRGLETEISEVKRYVEQSYLERKQSAAVARDVSNAQAHEIIKMQDQIKGLEHRLGLAQDRIAEIHPSGCVPPVKSKPKSQLKTDRAKKVK